MSRDIALVIPDIISIIPKTEIVLLEKIKIFVENLGFKAPELRKTKHCWNPFMKILNEYIPNISEEWQIQIVKIVNDKNN